MVMKQFGWMLGLVLLTSCAGAAPAPVKKPTMPPRLAVSAAPSDVDRANHAFKELKRTCPASASVTSQEHLTMLFDQVVEASQVQAQWAPPLVLGCNEVNALSFPAIRQVIVFKGLLDLGLTDDELRFVLAHEISHHLPLPEDLRAREREGMELISAQLEPLNANCKKAMAQAPASQRAVVAKSCRGVVETWMSAHVGQSRQQIERFVDITALEIIDTMGIDMVAASSALAKISEGEKLTPPTMDELIRTSWDRSFRSHPPAYERLQYIEWAKSLVQNAKSFGTLPEFYN